MTSKSIEAETALIGSRCCTIERLIMALPSATGKAYTHIQRLLGGIRSYYLYANAYRPPHGAMIPQRHFIPTNSSVSGVILSTLRIRSRCFQAPNTGQPDRWAERFHAQSVSMQSVVFLGPPEPSDIHIIYNPIPAVNAAEDADGFAEWSIGSGSTQMSTYYGERIISISPCYKSQVKGCHGVLPVRRNLPLDCNFPCIGLVPDAAGVENHAVPMVGVLTELY